VHQLSLSNDLIVDSFAGGGGASVAIEQALGHPVHIAINHDPEAVAMHTANHPYTQHFCEDVFKVVPREVTKGRRVGLLWASPDCKHFSKAKGGKPVSRRVRGLAWVVVRWAVQVKPEVIFLENVEEFTTWGPLLNGRPDPERKGQTFKAFVTKLQQLGYVVEWRELRACDYGAPTIRKRLFLVARCDGRPIVWPTPTHNKGGTGGLKAYRTAAECIDWNIPCPSIFERNKPLAENTMRRIARGIVKYVIDNPKPFILKVNHGHDFFRGQPIDEPLQTHTSKNGYGIVAPTLVQTGYGERPGQAPRAPGLDKPLGTVVAGGQKHALISAFLTKFRTGATGSSVDEPVHTITAGGFQKRPGGNGHAMGLVAAHIMKMKGSNIGHSADEPMHTVTSGGMHFAEVRAFLLKYYGTAVGSDPRDPLHTVTSKIRFGLVVVQGVEYQIVDIGMRMLTPRELYRAQGFPEDYVIDTTCNGKKLSVAAQVRMCGNSVSPYPAAVLIRANVSTSPVFAGCTAANNNAAQRSQAA
jgi:DNA (cytosine-5)-methyltransferase 1